MTEIQQVQQLVRLAEPQITVTLDLLQCAAAGLIGGGTLAINKMLHGSWLYPFTRNRPLTGNIESTEISRVFEKSGPQWMLIDSATHRETGEPIALVVRDTKKGPQHAIVSLKRGRPGKFSYHILPREMALGTPETVFNNKKAK